MADIASPININCPACGVDVPCDIATSPTPEGLTVTYDPTLLNEHVEMHRNCTCVWTETGRQSREDCPVHA